MHLQCADIARAACCISEDAALGRDVAAEPRASSRDCNRSKSSTSVINCEYVHTYVRKKNQWCSSGHHCKITSVDEDNISPFPDTYIFRLGVTVPELGDPASRDKAVTVSDTSPSSIPILCQILLGNDLPTLMMRDNSRKDQRIRSTAYVTYLVIVHEAAILRPPKTTRFTGA
jgi:hypothetical protein